MKLRIYRGILPSVADSAYVDPAAVVIGDVEIGADSPVWPGAGIRGDVQRIRIGARSNVQDGGTVHVTHDGPYTPGGFPTLIGDALTIAPAKSGTKVVRRAAAPSRGSRRRH